jgi:hypothetical protein
MRRGAKSSERANRSGPSPKATALLSPQFQWRLTSNSLPKAVAQGKFPVSLPKPDHCGRLTRGYGNFRDRGSISDVGQEFPDGHASQPVWVAGPCENFVAFLDVS